MNHNTCAYIQFFHCFIKCLWIWCSAFDWDCYWINLWKILYFIRNVNKYFLKWKQCYYKIEERKDSGLSLVKFLQAISITKQRLVMVLFLYQLEMFHRSQGISNWLISGSDIRSYPTERIRNYGKTGGDRQGRFCWLKIISSLKGQLACF